MEKIRLDLFKLIDENDKGQGVIKALNTQKLKKKLKILIEDIKEEKKQKIKDVAELLNLSYLDFYNKLFRRNCSLPLLKELIKLWGKVTRKSSREIREKKIEIQEEIKILTYGAGNTYKSVKVVHFLSENLCKIVGALIADGHLTKLIKPSGSPSYVITIDDKYEDNLSRFCSWIREEFGVRLKPKYCSKNNYWRIDFGNKIIYRYLEKLFEVPVGKKYEKLKVPPIIKKSSLNFKVSFLNSLFLFDGGIGKSVYFNFSTKSLTLLKDIEKLLKEIGINPDLVKETLDSSNVFEVRIWKRKKLKKFIEIFQSNENAQKWKYLNSLIH